MSFDHPMLAQICRLCTKQVAGSMQHLFQPSNHLGEMSVLNRTIWVTSLEIYEGDGLPAKVCNDCLEHLNDAYKFKRQCFASDRELRDFYKEIGGFQGLSEEFNSSNELPTNNTTSALNEDDTDCVVLFDNQEDGLHIVNNVQSVSISSSMCSGSHANENGSSSFGQSVSKNNKALLEKTSLVGRPQTKMKDLRVTLERLDIPTNQDKSQELTDEPGEMKLCCFTCKQCFTDSQALNMHLTKHAKCFDKSDERHGNNSKHANDMKVAQSGNKTLTGIILEPKSTFSKPKDITQSKVKQKSSESSQQYQTTNSGKNEKISTTKNQPKPFYAQPLTKPLLLFGRSDSASVTDFNSVSNLVNSHIKPIRFDCKYCVRSFSRKPILLAHIRNVHTSEHPYECDFCKKKFAEKRSVKYHIHATHMEKPFKCSICPKGFLRQLLLTDHMRYHNNERPYKCSLCDKTYAAPRNLQQHLVSHSGGKNFHCDLCEKSFSHNTTLKAHKAVHSGIKAFKCPTCGREYYSRPLLKHHMKYHGEQKVKPLKCKLCYVRFSHTQNLERHLRKHESGLHKCTICEKQFRKKCLLANHLFLHLNESDRPHGCTSCKRKYATKGVLDRHIFKKHPETRLADTKGAQVPSTSTVPVVDVVDIDPSVIIT